MPQDELDCTQGVNMDRRATDQAALLAALLAFACTLLMGFVLRSPDPNVSLQPSYPVTTPGDVVRTVNTYPEAMLRLFAADSLFIVSYVTVFAGLYATAADRSRVLAAIGLGAGVLTALFDAIENAYFITYAQAALNGVPLVQPDLPAIYVAANLKWMSAFVTLFAFGLAWPRATRLGWVLAGLMLLFVLVGVLGIAWPGLFWLRGVLFLVGMPLFAWHFWRESRRA